MGASREDWDNLRRGWGVDDDDWDDAIDDLDRDHEHGQYYEAQERARDRMEEYENDRQPEDYEDLDAQHDWVDRHARLAEEARAAAVYVAEQRYEWHGRWDAKGYEDNDDDDDDNTDGHEEQADSWAQRGHNIGQQEEHDLERLHDNVDRRHAYGNGMLMGLTGYNEENDEDEDEDEDEDDDDEGQNLGDLFDQDDD